MDDLTESQLKKMKHALDGGNTKPIWYRNFYCAWPENPDVQALVKKGMMEPGRVAGDDLQYFHVTKAGRKAVKQWMGPDYKPEIRL